MKIQTCRFQCDRPDCKHESPAAETWTEVGKLAKAAGWFIRPSDSKPEHICPPCVDLALTGPPAKAAATG